MKNYEIIVGLYGYSEKIEKNNEKYETFWFAKSWWAIGWPCGG
jgi:hypothetical protein